MENSQFIESLKEMYYIYPNSINYEDDTLIMIIKGSKKKLLVSGKNTVLFEGLESKLDGTSYKICELNHYNANICRELLPFSKPIRVLKERRSFGCGDRLGIASPIHARLFKNYDCYPILAQQSIRELNLTNRTYEDVLDSATFGVIEEGYKRGFGADGDHLKKESEIKYALGLGFSMLTLDCSEHIRNDINGKSEFEILKEANLPSSIKDRYLNKTFIIEDNEIKYNEVNLAKCYLIYNKAIEYATYIYHTYVENKDVDFELSIDETSTPTTPIEHFYVANELTNNNVILQTVAPRFCGQFQKGIDYKGDLKQFEKEIKIHASIARFFKYKLSIHSGSDKFSTFEIIGKYTLGNFHVKTAGTNYLEAMKVVAICDPSLYRSIHKFALSKFDEACKYYHVTTNLNNIPDADKLEDDKLVDLFVNEDARQLIHIVYGYILTELDENGNYLFKDKLYKLWDEKYELYRNNLMDHIGHHLDLLYKGFSN